MNSKLLAELRHQFLKHPNKYSYLFKEFVDDLKNKLMHFEEVINWIMLIFIIRNKHQIMKDWNMEAILIYLISRLQKKLKSVDRNLIVIKTLVPQSYISKLIFRSEHKL